MHTECNTQHLRRAFSAVVHTKRKRIKEKKEVFLIHLQLGHVSLTFFFLLADSQPKSGDTLLSCYWQRATGLGVEYCVGCCGEGGTG